MQKFKPQLLLKKKFDDLTTAEREWMILLKNDPDNYEITRDLATEEISVFRTGSYKESLALKIVDGDA